MATQSVYTLTNPQNGNLAFKLYRFDDNSYFDHLQRNNYFSLIWVTEGAGEIKSGFATHSFGSGTMFAFAPYQPFMLASDKIEGTAIHFHSDFFCIHRHHAEIACNGVLFNNVYEPPYIKIDEKTAATLVMLTEQMKEEVLQPGLAQHELLVSYLKIFLITTSRLKVEQRSGMGIAVPGKEPQILQNLKDSIEQNFKSRHAPADYAEELNISPKALAKITRNHFNKTLTNLIAERIVIEAKRELYLTDKTVKEIAYELGYNDEYYFSRFFKTNADVSPQLYRDTVGFARAMQ